MLVRYFVALQGCPSTCTVPLPVYSSVIIRSRSWSLRSMPIYQPQLKRTDFRSFAPAAGVYVGPPRPRPPPPRPPPPGPCAPAGACAPSGACAFAKDSVPTASTAPMAILVKLILRGKAIMSLFFTSLFGGVRGCDLDHVPVRHRHQQQKAQRT